MNYLKRFEKGTTHKMAKGTLNVKDYVTENDILYMIYTLNDDPTEHKNKYVNIISSIYKYQKKHNISGIAEAALSLTHRTIKAEKIKQLIENEIEQEKTDSNFPHAYFTIGRDIMFDLVKQHENEDIEVVSIKENANDSTQDLAVIQIEDRLIGIRKQLLETLIA